MSETVDGAAYGELLGEYLDVVCEIAPLLDETGRPAPRHREEYDRLRAQKREIRSALDRTDGDDTDLQRVIEDAFGD